MQASMPRMRQVWHVFAKDLRRHKWMLLLFTVQAFVASLGLAVQDPGPTSTTYGAALLYVTLPITAAVLVATIVLDDAPTLARAWWASLALSREAVFGAKLLIALGLIPLLLILSAAALQWTFGVRGHELVLFSWRASRWIVLIASLVLPLAALQHDLRSFLLAGVASVVAAMLLLTALSSTTGAATTLFASAPTWFTYWSFVVVSTLLPLVMTWHIYRTRSRPWKAWGVLLLLVAFAIVGSTAMPSQSVWGQSKRLESARLRAVLEPVERPSWAMQAVKWDLRLEALPPELRGTMHLPLTRYAGSNACRRLIAFGDSQFELQSPRLPLPGAPVRWRGSPPQVTVAADSVWSSDVPVNSQAPANCTLPARAELHVHEPRYLASIPLGVGQSFTRNGYRVSVQNTDPRHLSNGRFANAIILATLQQSSSIPARILASNLNKRLSFVLVHSDRREAILLQAELGSSYGGLGSVSSAEILLVLRDSTSMSELRATDPRPNIWQKLDFTDEAEFDLWLRGAELAVFEWKLIGVIHAEIVSSVERGRSVTRVVERVK